MGADRNRNLGTTCTARAITLCLFNLCFLQLLLYFQILQHKSLLLLCCILVTTVFVLHNSNVKYKLLRHELELIYLHKHDANNC